MIRIYDTRAGKKVDLIPREPGKIGLYVCGVTVYDLCHVGHARTLVAFDVIVRYLKSRGFDVRLVRNVTDVDDKIIRRGIAEGKGPKEVADFYTQAMADDMAALGVAMPTVEPRATQHLPEMIEVIQRLIDKGLAYASYGDVYFHVPSFSTYGQLSGQSVDDLKSGARIEVDEQKKSPLDFALWKGIKPGEPYWESPWGQGRPGWHIECSAMAHRYLGDSFDIHGGGSDLIFPHHENEIAQSEGAFGSFARYWMHSGMVNFAGEKMSKSLGNVVTIRKVAEACDLEALRLLLMSVHYRSPVGFSIEPIGDGNSRYPDLEEAEGRLDYFYRTLERLESVVKPGALSTEGAEASELCTRFDEAMDDDFNTALAIGHLYDAFVHANKIMDNPRSKTAPDLQRALRGFAQDARKVGSVLGIMLRAPGEFLLERRLRLCARRGIDPVQVETQISERKAARAAKDFKRADAVRDALKELGVELMDSADGTKWRIVG